MVIFIFSSWIFVYSIIRKFFIHNNKSIRVYFFSLCNVKPIFVTNKNQVQFFGKKYLSVDSDCMGFHPTFSCINIEVEYNNIKNNYSQEYFSLTIKGVDEVNATWSIVNSFHDEYDGVYGMKGSRIPSRQISSNTGQIMLLFNPILLFYFFDIEGMPENGFLKLIFIQNTGNCGEFASSMELLINDVTGFDTRIVHMEGKDHAFPEININNEWWVFDKIYTTPSQPIKSNDYASFLSNKDKGLFYNISDLKDDTNEVSVLSEHGFNSSNLTITAIKDITTNESDNEPMSNAVVEIFAYVNSYDPLVNFGKTDENGQYSTILRGDKEYLIIVKNENLKAIGFKDLLIPSNGSSSITVYLHKYD